MADFPPLAPVPPAALRSTIPSDDWEACLDAWMMLLGVRLNATDQQFQDAAVHDVPAVSFLESYYQHVAAGDAGLVTGPKARRLRKLCFLATRRFLLSPADPPEGMLDCKLWGNLCCCFPSSTALKTSLSKAWDLHSEKIISSLEKTKALIIKQLSLASTTPSPEVMADVRRLTILASVLPPCGQVLMAGSDFLDTLSDAYRSQKNREDLRRILVANIYVCMISLLKEPSANLSLLLDQLFSLKAAAGLGTPRMKKEPTLLSDLICSSDLLLRLEKYLTAHPQKRAEDLLVQLRIYQMESKPLHHRYQRRKKADKGKGPSSGALIPEELHVHKMSLVTQVQDLFPDLGSGFIVRLLEFYNDNPETIVAHLLDDNLPPELQSLDRTEQLPPPQAGSSHDALALRPTPPAIPSPPPAAPTRKNIFDADIDIAELSRSEATTQSKSKLRFGRANPDLTADEVLADRSQHATNKAAILSALANFDSDDDERDDTYDVADVGGTVDATTAGTDAEAEADMRNRRADQLDMILFRAYKSNPALFARDSATRRSQPRASLKRDTEMTDEAIEGWAVMLSRDPKRLARLEDRLALDSGGVGGGALNQTDLPSTSYRKPRPEEVESDEEGDSSASAPPRGGRGGAGGRGGGGRGRGRGGRGRGGRPPPQSGEQSGAASRQKKEENKASRANHNRRQQRAKKIARGGGLPG